MLNVSIANNSLNVTVSGILFIASIVAMWIIFQKAGEKGWKSIIPFYNGYVAYKLFWKKAIFWVSIILVIAIMGLTTYAIYNAEGNLLGDANAVAQSMGYSDISSLEDDVESGVVTIDEVRAAAERLGLEKGDVITKAMESDVYGYYSIVGSGFSTTIDMLLILLAGILSIVMLVINIIFYHRMSKSFGHGVGYTLGLIFLSPIFLLILAFGSSKYQKLEA